MYRIPSSRGLGFRVFGRLQSGGLEGFCVFGV